VKQRLYVENLLRIRVPALSQPAQAAVVERWRAAEQSEAEHRNAARELATSVAETFMTALGLKAPAAVERRRALAASWSDMPRWAVAANRVTERGALQRGRYSVGPLSHLIEDLENGWSPKCLPRPAEDDEWGVLKVGAVSLGRYTPSENKALPTTLEPEPRLEIQAGDFLIGRANITRLVGASAYVLETPPRLLLCDKIFRVRWQYPSPLDPGYLDEVLKLPHLRQTIEAAATGSSPTMKNISKPALLALPIPQPPIEVQRALAREAGAIRSRIDDHLRMAGTERRNRIADVNDLVLQLAADQARGGKS
jgi:type I restriction enzyme S subunit